MAHDDALVPNIDDIPGEQGYVQYGAYAYFMHGIGPEMAKGWPRDGPEMAQRGTREGPERDQKTRMGSYGMR
jgi:hypothetical protein